MFLSTQKLLLNQSFDYQSNVLQQINPISLLHSASPLQPLSSLHHPRPSLSTQTLALYPTALCCIADLAINKRPSKAEILPKLGNIQVYSTCCLYVDFLYYKLATNYVTCKMPACLIQICFAIYHILFGCIAILIWYSESL